MCREFGLYLFIFKGVGLIDRDTRLFGDLLDGARLELAAPARAAVRLGVD